MCAAPQAGRTPHIGCTPCHTPHAGRTCTPRHMVARVARRESWRAALKASSTTVLRLYPRSKSVSHYVLQRWLALQIAGWLHRFLLQRGWKPTRLWHHHDDGLDAQLDNCLQFNLKRGKLAANRGLCMPFRF